MPLSRGAIAADFFPDAQIDAHHDMHHDFIFGGSVDHDQAHHHMATSYVGTLGEAPGVVGPGAPFDIPPDSVLDAMKAVMEGQEEEERMARQNKLAGLKVPAPLAAPDTAAGPAHFEPTVATAGFHIDFSALKVLKTAVLVTGGMASKLFGIGMMGFLVFQSFKSQAQQQQASQQRSQNQGRLQCNDGGCTRC
mmetsp:Transcript_10167/g.16672  ORF Transcript_10167/g.16672 Transcript_10167/m.16672 type:complete len:193 (+) Transcript_10167:79-657(+)